MNYIYSGKMVFDCMKLVNELTRRAPGGLDEEATINGKCALAIMAVEAHYQKAGVVDSLARPGGTVTGITNRSINWGTKISEPEQ